MTDSAVWANVVLFPYTRPPLKRARDVERINQYPLYELGKTLESLMRFAENETAAQKLFVPITHSIRALNDLLAGVPFPLTISKTAAEELRIAVQGMNTKYFTKLNEDGKRAFNYPDDNVIVPTWEWSWIKSRFSTFETILAVEVRELSTYFVPPRGIYSTAALIDFADKSFPAEIFGHVPEKAKDDWRAAGRCLAFNLLSATGFHVARAVEATLEVYYQLFTGESGTLNGWYDYIKALSEVMAKEASPSPSPKTIAELVQMKDDYRNPVMHPRVTLTESDARMLFDNGESLIIAMAGEIKALREAGGIQGALTVLTGVSALAAS